jgi:uncharacterized protein (DUF1501 family)
MHRRYFVKSGAVALATMGLSPAFLRRSVFAAEPRRAGAAKGKVLVCLFQRGAADGLNMVVPHGDGDYYALRPGIAIPRPAVRAPAAAADDAAIDLDGFFGLHPSLAPLLPLWRRGMLAPVHAVGSPSATRSHFDAQDYMETGTPDVKSTPDGWLNRYLAVKGTCAECALTGGAPPSPFRAIALAPQTPRILEGPQATVAMSSIDEFSVRTVGGDSARRLEALYRTGSADVVHDAGREMFDAVRMLRAADPQRYSPEHGAEYPASPFGQRLRQIAQLIKASVGLEVAFADVGGWDTHVNQGGSRGQLAQRLDDFARSIAALVTDLDERMDDVVVLTMSEFGRMARENGSRGTDHGHAGALFVIGGGVRGGRVHGRWPGLAPDRLYEGRDLALTTDFRSVFGEVAAKHLGVERLDALFPGYEQRRLEWLGLI